MDNDTEGCRFFAPQSVIITASYPECIFPRINIGIPDLTGTPAKCPFIFKPFQDVGIPVLMGTAVIQGYVFNGEYIISVFQVNILHLIKGLVKIDPFLVKVKGGEVNSRPVRVDLDAVRVEYIIPPGATEVKLACSRLENCTPVKGRSLQSITFVKMVEKRFGKKGIIPGQE
jgi:hypothetical protein